MILLYKATGLIYQYFCIFETKHWAKNVFTAFTMQAN